MQEIQLYILIPAMINLNLLILNLPFFIMGRDKNFHKNVKKNFYKITQKKFL